MQIVKCKESDKENSIKYLLTQDNKEIGCGYIFAREINPIEIYIIEEMRSNGYGKLLFTKLLQIVYDSGRINLVFDIELQNYRMNNILSSLGAQHVGTNDEKNRWVIPV